MRLRVSWLALVALVACADPTPPDRASLNLNDIHIPLTPGLIFHWSTGSLPMRVWVQPGSDLHFYVANAIKEWESNAVLGEFRAVMVEDSAHADVKVFLGATIETDPFFPDRACSSSTSWGVFLVDSTIVLPFRTTFNPHTGFGPQAVADCFTITAVHELGHPIGLIGNSENPDDVMYGLPSTAHLSPRDQATFLTLYHTPSTVRLPPGR